MKNRFKNSFLSLAVVLLFVGKIYSQESSQKNIPYNIIAQGLDSPYVDLQVVCFNKYFNLDRLSDEFREKYNLNQKDLYKKKMLIQIFKYDKNKEGIDKIDVVSITENDKQIFVKYNVVNSDNNNDTAVAPFIIIQVDKSKKDIQFIENGISLEDAKQKLYIDN